MAIINCPECDKKISSEAKICPQCGYRIKKRVLKRRLLDNKLFFVFSIILDIFIGIIGLLFFNKGKYEMLFWVNAKRDLGAEDAMYCIKNIGKYTFMKNVGIFFCIISIILLIIIITYKFFIKKKVHKAG